MATRRRIPLGGAGLRPERFRPTAAPVDRFVNPERQDRLRQLASGLSQLAPALTQATMVSLEKDNEKARLEGEERARELVQEGLTYRKAIEDGLITPDQSPWFRQGAREFFGRNAGTRYRDFLSTRLARSAVAESTELSDFDALEREARAEFVASELGEEPDQAAALAFGRSADALVSGVRSQFAQAAGQRLVRNTRDEVQSSIMGVALDAHTGNVTPEAAASVIKMDVERAINMGFTDKGSVNRLAAQAIIDAARRTNDEDLLQILDHIETSPGNTLSMISDVAQSIEAAEEDIRSDLRLEAEFRREQTARAKADAAEELSINLWSDMISAGNPFAVSDFNERVLEIAKFSPSIAQSAFSARTAIAHGMTADDPQAVERYVLGVYSGEVDMQTALDAAAAGEIGLAGLNQVLNAVNMVRSTSGGGTVKSDPAFDVDAYRHAEARLRAELGGSTDPFAAIDEDTKQKVERALQFLRREWYEEFHRRGAATKSYLEQIQSIDPLTDTLIKRFSAINPLDPSAPDLPSGPANPGDPRWMWQPLGTPDALSLLEGFTSVSRLTPTQHSYLNALGVEILPGDDAATAANISEALKRQHFLFDLKTRGRR